MAHQQDLTYDLGNHGDLDDLHGDRPVVVPVVVPAAPGLGSPDLVLEARVRPGEEGESEQLNTAHVGDVLEPLTLRC